MYVCVYVCIYRFMNSTYVISRLCMKKVVLFLFFFFSCEYNSVSRSITRGLSLLDAPPKRASAIKD